MSTRSSSKKMLWRIGLPLVRGAVAGGLATFLVASCMTNRREAYEHRGNLYSNAVEAITDLDGQPGASSNDWAQAYADLGYSYDVHVDSPRKDLSNADFERIVDMYKLEPKE